MPPETTGLHVNPSDETIRLGPLAVRFLLTGDYSTGSVAAVELAVPAAREAAEVMNATAGGPPDRAKMAEIMRRHGLTPTPPPPQT